MTVRALFNQGRCPEASATADNDVCCCGWGCIGQWCRRVRLSHAEWDQTCQQIICELNSTIFTRHSSNPSRSSYTISFSNLLTNSFAVDLKPDKVAEYLGIFTRDVACKLPASPGVPQSRRMSFKYRVETNAPRTKALNDTEVHLNGVKTVSQKRWQIRLRTVLCCSLWQWNRKKYVRCGVLQSK